MARCLAQFPRVKESHGGAKAVHACPCGRFPTLPITCWQAWAGCPVRCCGFRPHGHKSCAKGARVATVIAQPLQAPHRFKPCCAALARKATAL
eukprot:6721525-Alexandrium_andersonii.AAC.1